MLDYSISWHQISVLRKKMKKETTNSRTSQLRLFFFFEKRTLEATPHDTCWHLFGQNGWHDFPLGLNHWFSIREELGKHINVSKLGRFTNILLWKFSIIQKSWKNNTLNPHIHTSWILRSPSAAFALSVPCSISTPLYNPFIDFLFDASFPNMLPRSVHVTPKPFRLYD